MEAVLQEELREACTEGDLAAVPGVGVCQAWRAGAESPFATEDLGGGPWTW